MRAIRIEETGGAEKLRLVDLPIPAPGLHEVRILVEAAGINFIDTYQRSGLYPVNLPFVLGQEVAGIVTSVGANVSDFKIGQRVATVRALGGYADEALAPAAQVVAVPPDLSIEQAATAMIQGLTAHFLSTDTFSLQPGHTALIHAAAGGVGLLLVQMAKRRGARVIATVSTEEKAKIAREAGADEVVLYTRENFAERTRELTQGQGAHVVYDSVGRDTFNGSIDSLRPRGMLVSFGNASGPVPPFAPLLLSQKGSLFLTRPTLPHYTQTTMELRGRAAEVFRWIQNGELRVRIGAVFPLEAAAEAHRALESRATTGKVLLFPGKRAQSG
jgi:NADPH2:quinone reductase